MKLTKVVNIYPSMPITGVNPPIRSAVKRVTKSIEEIRTCLMSRAIVEEVLPSGETVRLDISNYDKCTGIVDSNQCLCGNCSGWKIVDSNDKDKQDKSPWQVAYDSAIAGKDLASMSRKQRRSAEAAARAAADAAVAKLEPEVVIGVASIENVEKSVDDKTESITDENAVADSDAKVELTENESASIEEEEVKTIDVEDTSKTIE